MRGINQAERKNVYHHPPRYCRPICRSVPSSPDMINKVVTLFSCSTRSWKNNGKGGPFSFRRRILFCAASSCCDRSIHHPFSFSNSFFHCSEIGPKKERCYGLFGSSKMHCTRVSVCEMCHVYRSFLSDTLVVRESRAKANPPPFDNWTNGVS